MHAVSRIESPKRHFLPQDFRITDWESLEPYFLNLTGRELPSRDHLEAWLRDISELEAVLQEDGCWRHIRMTCDTENKDLEESFRFFMMEIHPRIQPYVDQLNRKLVDNPFAGELDQKKFFTYLRAIRNSIELFREENIPIQAELNVLSQRFGAISGRMTVSVRGQEYTLQQASKFLESPDRELREEVYRKMQERRLLDRGTLNELYSVLIGKRQQLAVNAGFANYRDYKFRELGRFDYSKEDCFRFHEAVKLHVLPLVNRVNDQKKKKLGLDSLRPWDTEAEPEGWEPLHPFQTGSELLEKTIACFDQMRPFFGDCLRTMKAMGRLDLDSRKGKAPGGYNCPLAETGAPFIFMNAAGQMSDVTTMVHEGGHAIQSFLAQPLELTAFKEYPMEIAEVASMSMELFSMDHWQVFFSNEVDHKRARAHQLERVITIFPWIATIDKFQHWIYENPGHSDAERSARWMEILAEFSSSVIDWSGLETFRESSWQRQLHLFEVPFYYIEYGIAQLGALGLWMQYKQDPEQALDHYVAALSLGGTKTLPELYQTAGLPFNFSGDYIRRLMEFTSGEMDKLFL
jgi:oligoendopeptidase F